MPSDDHHDPPVSEAGGSVNQEISQDPLIYKFSQITGADSESVDKKAELVRNVQNVDLSDFEPDEAFKYQVYEAFNSSTESFRGPGSSMSDFRVSVYNLIDDSDIADPSYMGHNRAIKTTIIYTPSSEGLNKTLWGYEYDATRVAEAFFTGDLSDQVGFVMICFRSDESADKPYPVTMCLNARDADRFGPVWDEGGYLHSEDWSSLNIAKTAQISRYEDPDSFLVPLSVHSAKVPDKKVPVPYSDDNVRSYLKGVSLDLVTRLDDISDAADAQDYKKMADKSNELIIYAENSKKVISDLPVSQDMKGVVDDYLSSLDEFQKGGSYYWYGARFGDSDMLNKGAEHIRAGLLVINSSDGANELKTDLTEISDTPSTLFPDALDLDERYSYKDSRKSNDISAQIKRFHQCSVYTTKVNGKLKSVKCDNGNVFVSILAKITHLGYWGHGSSRIKTPKHSDFTLIYKGEEYHDVNPKYYSTTLGSPYVSKTINRKENEEGFLLFEVPEPFEPESAYVSLNLGKQGKPVWSLVDRS